MAAVTTNPGAYGQNSGEPEFLTTKDVAAIMNINVKTVYARAKKDEIPHYRWFKRTVRFRKDQFFAWLDKQSSGNKKH